MLKGKFFCFDWIFCFTQQKTYRTTVFLSKTQKIMKILKFHIKLFRETKYPNTNFVTRKNDLRGKEFLYILLLVFCPKCIFY